MSGQFQDRIQDMKERLQDWWADRNESSSVGRIIVILLVVYLLVAAVVGYFWSTEPQPFSVTAVAQERADEMGVDVVTGFTTTTTLIKVTETLWDKPGGYLSNDFAPPGVWLDNIPNWEFGVLVQIRDFTRALRKDFSRSQSQSTEDKDLATAEPQLHFDNDSTFIPDTEGEYKRGVEALNSYLARLSDPLEPTAQFYARADNLRQWLFDVETRLGSLSQRLSASVARRRLNTDIGVQQSTPTPDEEEVKTPWTEVDDVFYEARGTSWALLQILHAIEVDFRDVLEKKNAAVGVRQIIRELEGTQEPMGSPVILSGSGFGLFANHSLVMASYISRANAAIIDLRELLSQG
ncbi:MAG: DUF2333 family protein [Thalassolituus oleivorans]|uniref:DUF2333 family protein n=1 Tax=Thalassolituus oleivorans TaxID=187493 RepID=UPI001B46E612|nr:DUF2333 family protein [Thalassolituus oleivorans]MBQ0727377.1 DUF2333 family protein [Thalassolituus oleivorans]MBQ0782390.1 DUF2333 family protein [Thalassolituus oleivorans]